MEAIRFEIEKLRLLIVGLLSSATVEPHFLFLTKILNEEGTMNSFNVVIKGQGM